MHDVGFRVSSVEYGVYTCLEARVACVFARARGFGVEAGSLWVV